MLIECVIAIIWCIINSMNAIIRRIRYFFDRPSLEEVAAYQHKMPNDVLVETSYDKKTGFYTARVAEINGEKADVLIVTEGKTPEKLVEMVNDAILTYLDLPERMKRSMPKILPVDVNFEQQAMRRNAVLTLAK